MLTQGHEVQPIEKLRLLDDAITERNSYTAHHSERKVLPSILTSSSNSDSGSDSNTFGWPESRNPELSIDVIT